MRLTTNAGAAQCDDDDDDDDDDDNAAGYDDDDDDDRNRNRLAEATQAAVPREEEGSYLRCSWRAAREKPRNTSKGPRAGTVNGDDEIVANIFITMSFITIGSPRSTSSASLGKPR